MKIKLFHAIIIFYMMVHVKEAISQEMKAVISGTEVQLAKPVIMRDFIGKIIHMEFRSLQVFVCHVWRIFNIKS